MLGLLEEEREGTYWIEKEEGEAWDWIEEKRLGRAVSSKTRKKTSIHHVSVWTILSFHGY